MRSDDTNSGSNNTTATTNKKPKLGSPKQGPSVAAEPSMLPRPIALRQALENPISKWSRVPDLYKNDKEFVAEFIRKAHVLPSKAAFERLMPQAIRMSKEIALAFCSRSDFCELYADRQLYCPHNLSNDKEVIMNYVTKIPRALQMADSEICDDRDVILAAVNRDGFEIQYASCRLQADEEIIRAACRKSGRAIEVCTNSDTLEKLLHDRDFLLTTFRNGGGVGMRFIVDEALVKDEDLWLEAIVNGLAIRHLPKAISHAAFWVRVMRLKSSLYYDLPAEFQDNPNVARAAILAPDISSPLLDDLYQKMPEVFDGNREIAFGVVRKAKFAKRYLQQYPELFRDPEIMRDAVLNTPSLYFDVAEPLSLQLPIVYAALASDQAHRVLTRLGTEWLLRHEDICIEAIRVSTSLMEAANAISDEQWQNSRQLALEWLKRGCRVLAIFEPRLRVDRELAMAVAEHVFRDYLKIGHTFRQDSEFIKEAVSLNGRNLKHVTNPSMELVVSATGTYPAASAKYPGLSDHVVEKLALYDVFRGEFLRGISTPTSSLYQLNVDAETSTALKATIAQFLNVPTGKMLTLYHRCQASLQQNNNTNGSPPQMGLATTTATSAMDPQDLPLNFFGLRPSLRGGIAADNAQIELQRAANMMFDDGIPLMMLRMEQQRAAHDQNRLAQLMRMEEDLQEIQGAEAVEPAARHAMMRNVIRRARRRQAVPAAQPGNPVAAQRGEPDFVMVAEAVMPHIGAMLDAMEEMDAVLDGDIF